MGASTIPAASSVTPSDNWVQIAATNPAATTLNFTGISGYKKLMIFWYASTTPPAISSFRFNSDSGSKYAYGSTVQTPTLTTSATTAVGLDYLLLKIQSVDNTNAKEYSAVWDVGFGAAKIAVDGLYQASAAITSVNIAWAATFSNTVYLYGVAA